MADKIFDTIVIGCGISSGWAAKELCEKELKKDAKRYDAGC